MVIFGGAFPMYSLHGGEESRVEEESEDETELVRTW